MSDKIKFDTPNGGPAKKNEFAFAHGHDLIDSAWAADIPYAREGGAMPWDCYALSVLAANELDNVIPGLGSMFSGKFQYLLVAAYAAGRGDVPGHGGDDPVSIYRDPPWADADAEADARALKIVDGEIEPDSTG